MSLNHWKLLNQLKITLLKYSAHVDKVLNNSKKDMLEVVSNKLSPSIIASKEYARILTHLLKISKENMKNRTASHTVNNYISTTVATSENCKEIHKIAPKHDNRKTDASKNFSSNQQRPWMARSPTISCRQVEAHMQQLLLDIESMAVNSPELPLRLEMLSRHFGQYPEARVRAVKIGVIRLLLKLRRRSEQQRSDENDNDPVLGPLRECLARLGYADPVAGQGIRILAMDGGGIRGLIVLRMLKKLEELTGRRLHDLFDVFCGVSTGALITLALGIHEHSLDEVTEAYRGISAEIFKQSPIWGTSNLVWSHSYYDTPLWERKLRENLGERAMISTARIPNTPKLLAVSAIVNQTQLAAYVFRNYSLPWRIKSHYFGSSRHQLWQAARASAAAPTYFEEFRLGRHIHQDGGILVNNPTAVAIHEARLIWPTTPIQCVVSFGTGRIVPNPADLVNEQMAGTGGGGIGVGVAVNTAAADSTTSTSWANKFYKILDSATDTEGVNIMLNDLLPANTYYRFNPYLTNVLSMVETDPDKLDQMEMDTILYLSRNEEKFRQVAAHLTQRKTWMQKLSDYINYQRTVYGF